VQLEELWLGATPALVVLPVPTRSRSALCSDRGEAKASSGARRGARRGLGSGRWGDEAQQLDDAALEDAVVAAREGGARWEDRRWGAGWGESALAEAVRVAQRAHALRVGMAPTILLEPPMDELYALEWLASIPPSALRSWHVPRIEVAVITHRRPASLRRLLRSLACVPLLGDALDVTFSIEAGADEATLDLAHAFAAEWTAGTARVHERHAKGGLIAAVVEAWYPSGPHAYGVLLEDDIELSPWWYLFLKQTLLRYVYADGAEGGGGGRAPSNLLGISLYTPRLIELTMPRRRIDLYATLPPVHPGGGGLFLQQLPCSWGSLFFPEAWAAFHEYMHARLAGRAPAITIPGSATNGWKTSWKKFLIELAYLRGYVVLYPNFGNQSSFSTNHLEPGEHIASKTNRLAHLPIDFTVPLLEDFHTLRTLWAQPAAGDEARRQLDAWPPLHTLPTLDLFSQRSSQEALVAQGEQAGGVTRSA